MFFEPLLSSLWKFSLLALFLGFARESLVYCMKGKNLPANSTSKHYINTGFNRTNPHDVELMLVYREAEVFKQMTKVARSSGFTIQGFYHTSTWQPRWKEVIEEQLKLLDGRRRIPRNPESRHGTSYQWDKSPWTSLLAASQGLYLNVGGPSPDDRAKIERLVDDLGLISRNKITIGFNKTVDRMEFIDGDEKKKQELNAQPDISTGEFSTINRLHDYCIDKFKSKQKAIVYYLHSKGSCCYREHGSSKKMPTASWRELMNTFNIEFPSICLRALLKGYNTCGVENQDAHYSGNFWWADCDHVAQLRRTARFDPWDQEFFVQRYSVDRNFAEQIGFHCGYCMYNCEVNLYDVDCKREWYRDRLFKMVMGKIGPSNRGRPHTNDTNICKQLRVKPYNKNQPYMRELLKPIGIE